MKAIKTAVWTCYAVACVLLSAYVYKNPPKTATIKFNDGRISSAALMPSTGKITLNGLYPVYKTSPHGRYIIGIDEDLDKTEQVQIIAVKAEW